MRVLVMGATRFNGLALVRELVKHGHEVTTFNCGQSEAVLPRGVRRLYGDRTEHARLREVLGDEEFDCVQDMSAYTLEDVRSMDEVFRGRIGHYIFASSTAIYAASKILPIRETHPVDRSERQIEYGINKLLCEDYLVDGLPAARLPGLDRAVRLGLRAEQHDSGPRAADVHPAAARAAGADPRRRQHPSGRSGTSTTRHRRCG